MWLRVHTGGETDGLSRFGRGCVSRPPSAIMHRSKAFHEGLEKEPGLRDQFGRSRVNSEFQNAKHHSQSLKVGDGFSCPSLLTEGTEREIIGCLESRADCYHN